ncbi:E3 SUMO-protein ligase ZBED1-like [Misgurnus anguillicaudatus]|uniref:E3 SUMO-protein ligase ZBED1-like n=1 Tax=Misgurnus anguillicaudatus TaxID=75329 RepID=UPI003CCF8DF6
MSNADDNTNVAEQASTSKETEDEIVDKRGKTNSVVWKWFGYRRCDKLQVSVCCKMCRRVVPTSSGNTSNLFYHLKHFHPLEHSESQKMRYHKGLSSQPETSLPPPSPTASVSKEKPTQQQTLMAAFMPYDKQSKRHKDITKAVTNFLAKDMMPFSTVENVGFRKMISAIDSRYELPGRKYFSRTAIPTLYGEVRKRVEGQLKSLSYFATNADLWSSRTSEPYMSLTVHFIDTDWKLVSLCLQTVYFPEDHTGEAIAAGLADALASWGLDEDRQVCITTDSGTNVIKAAELNKWTRLQCFGHRLNSAIEKVNKDRRVERAIGVCKKVVAAFSYSWKKKRDLAAAQEEYHLPKHKLISETPTRWGSRQQMVKRVLEQKRAITEVLSKDKKTRALVPTWQDVDVLESIDAALSPLLEFTDALSGESYVSVSFLKPVMHLFNNSILKEAEDDTELTRTIKRTVMGYLNEKYDDPAMDDLLDMACLVDPRFKLQYTQEEKRDYIKKRAVLEMLKGERAVVVREEESREEALASASAPAKKTKRSLASFFSNRPTTTTNNTEGLSAQQAVEKELGNYLLSPDADHDSNPLDWWKVYQNNFPRVSQLAQHYLCIQATSSPSERVFSTGGNIVTCKRASLKPDNVDQLVFLARNL